MRKLVFVLLCTLGLGGADEAPPLDMAALAQAQAAREAFRNLCDSRASSFASVAEYMDCFLAVDKAFVETAKVRDAKFYDSFALVMRKAVADRAAGKISAAQLIDAYRALWQELLNDVMAQEDEFMSQQVVKNDDPAMDLAAAPSARSAEIEAIRQCVALGRTVVERFECLLAATRAYAVTVKFRDMYRVDTFAAKIRLAVDDRLRGDLTAAQLADRFQSLHDALFATEANGAAK